jgi:chromate reductase
VAQLEAAIESYVIGISGSLRRRSYNTALLRYAAQVAPAGMKVELADIGGFPLFNTDVRDEVGFPEPVAALRRKLQEADGLLIASPEYNHSLTGPLKNAIDWLSTGADSPLDRKPTAIMGAGGRLGTAKSQAALRIVLAHNDVQVLNRPEVLVAGAWDHFDENLNLTNERTADQVRRLMFALAGQIRLHQSRDRAVVLGADDGTLAGIARMLDEAGYEVTATTDPDWAESRLKSGELALYVVEQPISNNGDVAALAAEASTRLLVVDGLEGFLDALDAGAAAP